LNFSRSNFREAKSAHHSCSICAEPPRIDRERFREEYLVGTACGFVTGSLRTHPRPPCGAGCIATEEPCPETSLLPRFRWRAQQDISGPLQPGVAGVRWLLSSFAACQYAIPRCLAAPMESAGCWPLGQSHPIQTSGGTPASVTVQGRDSMLGNHPRHRQCCGATNCPGLLRPTGCFRGATYGTRWQDFSWGSSAALDFPSAISVCSCRIRGGAVHVATSIRTGMTVAVSPSGSPRSRGCCCFRNPNRV
jgi:hypothetical protein